MPMMRQKVGAACERAAVESGIGGVALGTPPVYVAMGHMYFDSVEAFQTAFGPHQKEITADVANYGKIRPTLPISEGKL